MREQFKTENLLSALAARGTCCNQRVVEVLSPFIRAEKIKSPGISQLEMVYLQIQNSNGIRKHGMYKSHCEKLFRHPWAMPNCTDRRPSAIGYGATSRKMGAHDSWLVNDCSQWTKENIDHLQNWTALLRCFTQDRVLAR